MDRLFHAAWEGRTDVVQLLLDGKAEINHGNLRGNVPLDMAVLQGHEEMVKLLLKAGKFCHKTRLLRCVTVISFLCGLCVFCSSFMSSFFFRHLCFSFCLFPFFGSVTRKCLHFSSCLPCVFVFHASLFSSCCPSFLFASMVA